MLVNGQWSSHDVSYWDVFRNILQKNPSELFGQPNRKVRNIVLKVDKGTRNNIIVVKVLKFGSNKKIFLNNKRIDFVRKIMRLEKYTKISALKINLRSYVK